VAGVNEDEAEQALIAWASVERDDLVRAAFAAGVSKHRIYSITGIARTTIDRILEPSMIQIHTDRVTAYLARFTADWPRPELMARFSAPAVAASRTAEEIAEELLADGEFRALKLGTFLNTPDGQMTAAAVKAITPAPYKLDVELLIEALQLAGRRQHDEAQKAVGAALVLALGAAAVAALLANSGNA
jgi:hypothetical protein